MNINNITYLSYKYNICYYNFMIIHLYIVSTVYVYIH